MNALFDAKSLEKIINKTLKELDVPLTPDLASAIEVRLAEIFGREAILEILVRHLQDAAAKKLPAQA